MEDILKKVADTPSHALRYTVDRSHQAVKSFQREKYIKSARGYWHSLGPGLTTGAADDDPSGIATYSQAGSQFGFQLLWLAGFTFPLMAVVQEMCARIGLVTGRGLAGNIRIHYSKKFFIRSPRFCLLQIPSISEQIWEPWQKQPSFFSPACRLSF